MQQRGTARFLLREWADGCVVFDRRFGNTHALDSDTAEVFTALLAAPDDDPQRVVDRLSFSAPGQTPKDRSAIEQALARLAAHQLTARD